MADTKISNLNTAATPLAGTEVLPVVQAGQTKKVPVSTFQTALVSGTNIKTVNGNTLLGSGDLTISGGGSSALSIQNKTSAYTIVAGDNGTIINCTSGTFTVSLTAAATIGAGFNCWIWNTGTGKITIDPNASETIDGVNTISLNTGEGTQIICTGTTWHTGDKKTMRGYAENIPANSSRPTAGSGSIAIGVAASTFSDDIAIGNYSTANGGYSVAVGFGTNANAMVGVSIGSGATGGAVTSGNYSCGLSGGNPDANYAFSVGSYCSASKLASVSLGYYAKSQIMGKMAYAAGSFSSAGDSQLAKYVFRRSTTNATPTELTGYGTTAAADTQISPDNNSAIAFSGLIVAKQQNSQGTATAAWRIEGLIQKSSTVSSTVLVTSTVTVISNTPGWVIALSADTTNGSLKISATGAAATNIRWVANIDTAEVTY